MVESNDDYFGHCPVPGHENYYLNVGRAHWMVCDECRIKWLIGANLFSSWRTESRQIWQQNFEKMKDYKEV